MIDLRNELIRARGYLLWALDGINYLTKNEDNFRVTNDDIDSVIQKMQGAEKILLSMEIKDP